MQSLAPQLQLLQQQQGMQANQNASQATQAGAFGGSRFGIQQGLQNQSNQLAQNSLVGNAFNTAYNNAQQQFNTQNALGLQAQQANIAQQQFGANLGLQANTAAANAASTQSGIGNSQFSQAQNAATLQNQLGTEQQQYQQGLLNTQYQNYVNQLNYPYQQAAFAQNMISGYPVTTSTATTQPSSPSYLQDAASLGIGAYGLSQLSNLAKGGQAKVKRYAGISSALTSSPDSTTSVLEAGIRDAQSVGDDATVRALTAELNKSSGVSPISAAPTIPSSGAAAAGSYGANPNIGASGLTGGVGQMGISGANGQRSAAMPGSTASGSNSLIPQDLQTILQMKKDAGRAQPGMDLNQQLAEKQAVQDEVEAMNIPTIDQAKGGLSTIPLSDSVLPTVSKKKGGITDVASYNGEEDSAVKQAAASDMNDGSLDFGAPSTLNTIREDRGLPAVPVAQVQQSPVQQGLTPEQRQAIVANAAQNSNQVQQPNALQQAGLPVGGASPSIQAGLAAGQTAASGRAQGLDQALQGLQSAKPITPEDLATMMGPRPTTHAAESRASIAKGVADAADNYKTQKGLALIAMAGNILHGNRLDQGLQAALPGISKDMGAAMEAHQKAISNYTQLQANLDKAEDAESLGEWKDKGTFIMAANKNAIDYQGQVAKVIADINKANKESSIKAPEQALNAISAYRANPTPENKKLYDAAVEYLNLSHPAVLAADVTQGGANSRNTANLSDADIKLRQQELSKATDAAATEFSDLQLLNRKKYKALVDAAGGDENQAKEDYIHATLTAKQNALNRAGAPLKNTPAPSTTPPPAATGQPISVVAPNGVTYQFPTQKAADDFKKKAGIK